MPAPSREGQWNLRYDGSGVYPGADLTFGTLDTGIYLVAEPAYDYAESVLGDAARPLEDGIRFGRDYTSSLTVTFDLAVDTVDQAPRGSARHAANLDAVATLLTAWDAAAIRRQPGAVAALRVNKAGRVRRLYGRPRKIAIADSRFTRQGSTSLVAEYIAADRHWYDDVEQSTTVGSVAMPHRGLVGKLVGPLSQRVASPILPPGDIVVAGQLPTWPVITIYGPGRNPSCTFFGPKRDPVTNALLERMTIGLTLDLAAGEKVTIDPRPWARTVLRNGSSGTAGALTRRSPRMADMVLQPGQQRVRFDVLDDTGTARVTVAWRDAHPFH